MNQELLKQGFPQMPDFIRTMIADEVERQVSMEDAGMLRDSDANTRGTIGQRSFSHTKNKRRHVNRLKQTGYGMLARVAVILAALLVCGTSAYAAVKLYLRYQRQESHTAEISLEGETTPAGLLLPAKVPEVRMDVRYIPEELVDNSAEKGGISYINEEHDYGYFIGEPVFADSADPLHIAFLQDIENVTVGEHDALYLVQRKSSDPDWLWQQVFVLYPEVHRIVSVVGWGYAPHEELMRIAEGVELTETGVMVSTATIDKWSEVVAVLNENYEEATTAWSSDSEARLTASSEEIMQNLHSVGERFPVKSDGSLLAAVTDMQVYDDFSSLTRKEQIPESWLSLLGADGKIGSAVLSYIQGGDGVNTLHDVIGTKDQPLKLVYVTVEYTNNTAQDMENVWFVSGLMSLEETNGTWKITYHDQEDENGVFGQYLGLSMIGACEMAYYDVTGGARNNNYIPQIKAGESATVHMAWLVEEEKLNQLFITLNNGTGYVFSDDILETGLVELRK